MLAKKLNKGDKIGVIAPSDPIVPSKLEEMNASKHLLEQAGFEVVFGKNTFSNSLEYTASVEEKAEDIHQMFADPEIKAIFFATGGGNCNSLFESLEYELIKQNPKIICGFSDSTSLLNYIYAKTGLVTFHGPTFKSLTSWETDYGYQECIKRLVEGNRMLGQAEDEYITVQEGIAEGRLIGGNLNLIADLVSGAYHIDFSDAILFLEDLGLESEPAMLSHYLYHMKQNGVFEKIKGIWIGNYEHPSGITLEQVIKDVLGGKYTFPMIKSNNFGHTDKKVVIPIGTKAKIDTSATTKIQLLEDCVE